MHTGIYNHWLEGTVENRKTIYSLVTEALSSGKAIGELTLRASFAKIATLASDQTSFNNAVNKELEQLAYHRSSIPGQPFTNLVAPITKTELAERFALAYLIGLTHDQVTENLEFVSKNLERLAPLVNGLSMEYQKWILMKLRKSGFRGWEKYKNELKDFIAGKISIKDIKQPKIQLLETIPKIKVEKRKNDNSYKIEDRIHYLGFVCKKHITQEQLIAFHTGLIKKQYYWQGNIKQLDSQQISFNPPITWFNGAGRLVYLFTRLAELVFELPGNISLPPNALVFETEINQSKAKYKIAELKAFSSWLNSQLAKSFKNSKGNFYTRINLRNGKKHIMRLENEASQWKDDFENMLAVFN